MAWRPWYVASGFQLIFGLLYDVLGHNIVPDPIHAGGLRYHGMASLVRNEK
jgi:predicted alternative tryptophan synthase beta-subunit